MRCADGVGIKEKGHSHVSGGPWGGEGGSRWDDGVFCAIRQLIISHGEAIDSIQIEYDTKGCAVWSEKHGGAGGAKTDKIKFDDPANEHLISLSGHYGPISGCGAIVVRSLLFETNRHRYGPFGLAKGTHFSFSLTGGKIIGFYGRSGLYLDALGVYVKPFVQVTRTAQTHGQAVAHGNRGYDIMVAVREKMDNMVIAGGEFDKKNHKIANIEESEWNRYNGHVGTERDNQFNFLANQAHHKNYNHGYEDADHAYNNYKYQGVSLSGQPPRGAPLMGGRSEHKESNMLAAHHDTAFTTRHQTQLVGHGTEAGYNLLSPRKNDTISHVAHNGFAEYDTQKIYGKKPNPRVTPSKGTPVVTFGPWGGSGGMLFDDGVFTGVREIQLSRSGGVVSIRVCYDMSGQAVWGNKNGGSGAIRLDKITLDYPNEWLTGVSGFYGSTIFRGPTVVKSLTFFTNKKKYGPFGEEQGVPFSTGQKEGVIVGFHGRKGWFLDSLGVHFFEGKHSLSHAPRPAPAPYGMHTTTTTTADMKFSDQVGCGPVKAQAGQWGGNGGSPWDDGVHTGIRKIFLTRGSESIHAIQIEYDSDGKSTWSPKHGNNTEGTCHLIKLEYPNEFVTHITGYFGNGDECKKAIKCLTFHTNRGVYGPYGEESGTFFTSAKTQLPTKVVGFHGNSACNLYSIGVHTSQHCFNDRVDSGPSIKTMLHKIFS